VTPEPVRFRELVLLALGAAVAVLLAWLALVWVLA
jgi:hypothetical protein